MAVLIAAAMPVRIFDSLPVVSSVSILDLLLVLAMATLFLDLAFRPIDIGHRALFCLLCVPLVVSILSLVWSQDYNATLRSLFVYAEGLIVYLFVVRELSGVPAAQIVTYVRRFVYLTIIPALLLLFHVPGFAPADPNLDPTSGNYITYYVGLSHPILGPSNNLATVLAFFAPILLYWGHTRRDRSATIAGFITSIAIVLTLSRGVVLAFLIAGLLFIPFVATRRAAAGYALAKFLGGLAVGALAIAVFYAINSPTNEFFEGRFSSDNVETRFELYLHALEGIENEPLLGHGGGVVLSDPLPRLVDQATTFDLYSSVPIEVPDLEAKSNVHNTYLEQAFYFGLPLGLLVSLALWGTVGVFLSERRATILAGVIAYSLTVQLISFLFESSFEGTVLRVLFYMSVGLAIALLRSAGSDQPTTTSESP